MTNVPDIRVVRTDVLIAGCGGAGMRAAIEARARDAGVVLLAKGPVRANHTRMSGGRYNVVTGLNPDDSLDIFFDDTIVGGSGLNNQRLVRILVDEALDRAYDLESYGLVWERKTPTDYLVVGSGGGSRLRTLGSFDEGIGVSEVMLHECYRLGVSIREFQMLVDVLQDDDGDVVGGLVLDLRRGEWVVYEAASVVIATGGTSQLYETNSGPAINTGDGIGIAYRAGAELVDIEHMQFIPISFVYPRSIRGYTLTEPQHYGTRHNDVNGEPGKLLNIKGERFILKHDAKWAEAGTRDMLARAIMLEIIEGRGTPEGGVWLQPDPRVFEQFLHERPIYSKRILENYGEKAARFQEPLQVMPSALYTTGGIRIDENGRTTVPGLYAAGEAAGGVHGANRLGGNSMPDIQVFGRRAGLAAAADARERGAVSVPLQQARARTHALESALRAAEGVRPPHLKSQVQALMWNEVGLVRSAPGLTAALAKIRSLRAEVLPRLRVTRATRVLNREWMEAIELGNMLDVAEAMSVAALERTETRGAHYRTDFPTRDDARWLANLYVRREGEGSRVERRPLVTIAPHAALAAAQ
ncbi:MAG: FAD-binding protein [Chloroflexota bacterium]|nr:FAD-binding protein [Chloroflexota bacterium]